MKKTTIDTNDTKASEYSSIAFILPYFGKFKSYFQLFLQSVRNNPSVDWFIFTDCKEKYDYPENVTLIIESFEDFSARIRKKFPFNIALESPYKLCDYKPAYGEVLEEYLIGYDFWGFCDCDLILGDLRTFLTEDILKKYDKVFTRGHMTIFRNTIEVNSFYRKQTMIPYEKIYCDNHSFSFDEWAGISQIWDQMGLEYYDELIMDDICVGVDNLRPTKVFSGNGSPYNRTNIDESSRYKKMHNIVYAYVDGHLTRNWLQNGKTYKEEVVYVHLQKREMLVSENIVNQGDFLIRDGEFICYEDITSRNIRRIANEKITINNIKVALKRFCRLPLKSVVRAKLSN